MSTLARTPQGDLALVVGANGLKGLSLIVDRATAAALKLQGRFNLALGEWFLNTAIGVPYFQVVLIKNPDLGAIDQLFRKIILGTPPIVSVSDLSLDYDRRARTLAYSFRAQTDAGQTISGGSGTPFIVS